MILSQANTKLLTAIKKAEIRGTSHGSRRSQTLKARVKRVKVGTRMNIQMILSTRELKVIWTKIDKIISRASKECSRLSKIQVGCQLSLT